MELRLVLAMVAAEMLAVVAAAVRAGWPRGRPAPFWFWWAAVHLGPLWAAWRGLCGLGLAAGYAAAGRSAERYEQRVAVADEAARR